MNILEVAGFVALAVVGVAILLWAMGALQWRLTLGEGKDKKIYGKIDE